MWRREHVADHLLLQLRVHFCSQVTAFFNKTVELLAQECKTSLFDQGHLSTASPDVVQVYVCGDQSLFGTGSFRHNPPPGVDDVGVAQEEKVILFSDPIDEDHVTFEHAGLRYQTRPHGHADL